MTLSEIYTVMLDQEYSDMFEYEKKRASIWEAFSVKLANKIIDNARKA